MPFSQLALARLPEPGMAGVQQVTAREGQFDAGLCLPRQADVGFMIARHAKQGPAGFRRKRGGDIRRLPGAPGRMPAACVRQKQCRTSAGWPGRF